MRMIPRISRLRHKFGLVVSAVALLTACLVSAHEADAQCTTTVTGKVYSPAGPTTGDPIPNILVYVPQTAVLPFSSTVGQGVTGGCAAQANLVSGNPLVSATTDATGAFTLSTNGISTGTYNVVIQAGKWRQQYPNTPITACQVNPIGNLSMPAAQSSTADLPKIAVVTGGADSIECIFQQIGIDTTAEVTDPTGNGSINFYLGAGVPGQKVSASTPGEAALVGVPATLDNYDVVIFGCQGTSLDPQATTANQQHMVDYANAGGRIFATHYGYIWLDKIQPFESSATWKPGGYSSNTTTIFPATIDTTYPEGAILAQWLANIGALYTTNNTPVPNTIGLQQIRVDTSGVNNPPAQSWVKLNSNPNFSGNPSMQFTFNTPIGTTGIPTVAVTYTNTTTLFQPGDVSDNIVINVTNSSTTAADATLKLVVAIPAGITVAGLVDNSGGTWTCRNLVCTRSTPLAPGVTDSISMIFSIATTATVGQTSITASLSGGNLSSTGQCGRVLFNDYHVESPISAKTNTGIFPTACSTGLTSQGRFLEFSLYNLSNFVAPTTTDVILIEGKPIITWATPSPVYYGTVLSGTQLNATATFNGTTVPGTVVYTPAVGTEPAVGNDTLNVTFTPTDSTDYLSATGSVVLQVMPDATTTTLTNPNPVIYYGQIIADTSLESVASNGPAAINVGVLNFYIDSVLVCTLQASLPAACPAPTGASYNVGTHTVQSCYVDNVDGNFTGSCSPVYNVVVQPDPTTTVITSSADPSTPSQNVTLTANIVDQYATGAGTVNFYDGTLFLGSGVANAQGNASFSTASLIVGKHNITACLVASLDFNASVPCGTFLQLVTLVPTGPLTTVTLLTSSAKPSILGQSVTFAASVATTGAFVQIPAGTMTFFDGTSTLNSATLDSNGDATFTTSALTVGTHTITAAYIGNTTTAMSTSLPLQQVVLTTLPSAGNGFLLTVTPTNLSLGVGSSTTVSVSVLSLNNYNQAVQLSCSGMPNEATCTFAQSLIPMGGGVTTLTLSAAAPHACGASTPYFVATNGIPPTVPLLAATALVMFFDRRRRKLFRGLTLALLLCFIPMLNGCSSPCTNLGTQPNVYNVTVTATSTGSTVTSQSQVIQMNVHL